MDSSSIEDLIQETTDGLGLNLRQGKYSPVKGVYISKGRKLNIELSYNKICLGNQVYPDGGRWTMQLRPDYTLSIWPHGIEDPKKADVEALVVLIHFDAKSKVEDIIKVLVDLLNLEAEKKEEAKGT